MVDDVDDPVKLVSYANRKIRQYEERGETARLAGDLATASKYDFYLTKWADILQHALHEVHQEGRNVEDLGKNVRARSKRVRVNA